MFSRLGYLGFVIPGGFGGLGDQAPVIPILRNNFSGASWPWWLSGMLSGGGSVEHEHSSGRDPVFSHWVRAAALPYGKTIPELVGPRGAGPVLCEESGLGSRHHTHSDLTLCPGSAPLLSDWLGASLFACSSAIRLHHCPLKNPWGSPSLSIPCIPGVFLWCGLYLLKLSPFLMVPCQCWTLLMVRAQPDQESPADAQGTGEEKQPRSECKDRSGVLSQLLQWIINDD